MALTSRASLDYFHKLSNLQEIDLSSNLFDLFPGELRNCKKLKSIILIHNYIKIIDEEFLKDPPPDLETLILN